MGMDHYGSHNWKDIHENLFPIRTPKQVQTNGQVIGGLFVS